MHRICSIAVGELISEHTAPQLAEPFECGCSRRSARAAALERDQARRKERRTGRRDECDFAASLNSHVRQLQCYEHLLDA